MELSRKVLCVQDRGLETAAFRAKLLSLDLPRGACYHQAMDYGFKRKLWFPDQSTEAIFEPIAEMPPVEMITACTAFAFDDDGNVLLVKPGKRSWGTPGGHVEPGESPEDCVKREVYEEANVVIDNLTVMGRRRVSKLFDSKYNGKYPSRAYILFYLAHVVKVDPYKPELEVHQRAIVSEDEISQYTEPGEELYSKYIYARDFRERLRGDSNLPPRS